MPARLPDFSGRFFLSFICFGGMFERLSCLLIDTLPDSAMVPRDIYFLLACRQTAFFAGSAVELLSKHSLAIRNVTENYLSSAKKAKRAVIRRRKKHLAFG